MSDNSEWGEIQRPEGIKVMAILHLLLAGTGVWRISETKGALAMLRMGEPIAGGDHPAVVVDAYHFYAKVCGLYHTLDLLNAVCLMGLLVAAGICLLKDRAIGRTLSLIYAVASVLLRVGMLIFYTQVVHVRHVAYLQEIHKANPFWESLMPIPSSSGWFIGLLLGMAYPVWVWWYARKDEVKAYYEVLAEERAEE